MPITYGKNLARSPVALRGSGTLLMKAYTTHAEVSDVFLSYQHTDKATAWSLARYLDLQGIRVFIDVHDDTLAPGQGDLDDALMTAIDNSKTMIIIVSHKTQDSWWVPWEVGVSTPSGIPKALYKPQAYGVLPDYLEKLKRLWDLSEADSWVAASAGLP